VEKSAFLGSIHVNPLSIFGDIVQAGYAVASVTVIVSTPLRSLTTPQPHCLTILLQLRNQLISLFNHIVILLVLVIWPVCLDYTLSSHAINGAGNAFCCDEFGQVTEQS
jgi:hypothetical protein